MIHNLAYAVALLEKLCDSKGLDYSQEKKYWQERAQKSQENFEAEMAERAKTREAQLKIREAESAKRHEKMKSILAEQKARASENFTSSFD